MSRLPWLVLIVLLLAGFLLAFGLKARLAHADGGDRYTPSSRGVRPVVRRSLERSEVVDLASRTFGPGVAWYVASIAACESSLRPGADENPPYIGLLQVDPVLHADQVAAVVGDAVGPAEAAVLLRDPYVNLATAALIQRDEGWGAWPVCAG